MDPASAPAAHLPLAPDDGSVWHAGEIALQETAGARLLMQKRGPEVIRDHLIEQHRLFFPLLPFVVLGAVDGEGNVWSTVREGLPGFLVARDPGSLEINSGSDPSDPAEAGLSEGSPVGLLGIQLETRRRNRLNGVVRDRRDGGFAVTVEESYGNCPQYIQQRDFTFSRSPGVRHTSTRVETDALNAHHRALIASADTFFVASYVDRGPRRHVDVSHRGGKPGFVRINADPGFLRKSVLQYPGEHSLHRPRRALLSRFRDRGHAADLRQGRGDPGVAGDQPVPRRGTPLESDARAHRPASRRASVALDEDRRGRVSNQPDDRELE
jgi:predicted pyridoxine 5'-phosphate oxidase superfamily flavin-nucleotide-binding protein